MSDFFNFPMWAVEKPEDKPDANKLVTPAEFIRALDEQAQPKVKRVGRPKGSKNKESR